MALPTAKVQTKKRPADAQLDPLTVAGESSDESSAQDKRKRTRAKRRFPVRGKLERPMRARPQRALAPERGVPAPPLMPLDHAAPPCVAFAGAAVVGRDAHPHPELLHPDTLRLPSVVAALAEMLGAEQRERLDPLSVALVEQHALRVVARVVPRLLEAHTGDRLHLDSGERRERCSFA